MILKIGEIAFDETVEYNEEWTEMFPARYDRERRLDGARLHRDPGRGDRGERRHRDGCCRDEEHPGKLSGCRGAGEGCEEIETRR